MLKSLQRVGFDGVQQKGVGMSIIWVICKQDPDWVTNLGTILQERGHSFLSNTALVTLHLAETRLPDVVIFFAKASGEYTTEVRNFADQSETLGNPEVFYWRLNSHISSPVGQGNFMVVPGATPPLVLTQKIIEILDSA